MESLTSPPAENLIFPKHQPSNQPMGTQQSNLSPNTIKYVIEPPTPAKYALLGVFTPKGSCSQWRSGPTGTPHEYAKDYLWNDK